MTEFEALAVLVKKLDLRVGRLEREWADARAGDKPVHVGRFVKPRPEQVAEYARSIGYHQLDGQQFCDHYESKGWKIGKSPMKDWKGAVRTWKRKDAPPPEVETVSMRFGDI